MKVSYGKSLLILVVIICTALTSCGAPANTEPADTSAQSDVEWIIPEGVQLSSGTLEYSSLDSPAVIRSNNALEDNFSLTADIDLDGKGCAKIFFEAEFDEKGEIKNGLCATVDTRTGSFIIHLYNRYEAKVQSGSKFDTKATTKYSISINRKDKYLDCALYNFENKTDPIAASSLSLNQLKGKEHALSLLGNVKIENIQVGDIVPDNANKYTNPILNLNKDLGDPTVYYEDGKYYMMTTGRMNCYVSEDLVNFKDIGVVADTSKLYGHTYFGGGSIFKYDSTYYLFYTSYVPNDQKGIMCVATSDKVTGPYTQTKQTTVDEDACPVNSAGAFPFVADDGKTYLYWYETLPEYGNTIFGAEVEFKNGVVTVNKETKKRLVIPTEAWEKKSENGASGRVVERPNVYYHNGYYYLFYAGSHWKTSYGQGYAVSKTPLGDFEKYENNPILDSTASLHGVGCSYIVRSPDGSELFLVYHAHTDIATLRRNVCIDRIVFEENVDGADIAKVIGPTVTPQEYPK